MNLEHHAEKFHLCAACTVFIRGMVFILLAGVGRMANWNLSRLNTISA